MALKDTTKHMKDLLGNITMDLEKAENGNKAASQRVRTGTVKLEKIAKLYRKESIKNEKTTKGTKKPKKTASAGAKAKTAAKKPAAKAHKAKAHALSFKKPTAKLPTRRSSAR